MAYVTDPDFILFKASFMSEYTSSASPSELYIMAADIPCKIVLEGITNTSISLDSITRLAWLAAMTILELLGSKMTCFAFTLLIAFTKSSVDGFMVWPPETISSAPSSLNISSSPGPLETAISPNTFSGCKSSIFISATGVSSFFFDSML